MDENRNRADRAVSLTLVFFLLSGCAADDEFSDLKGPYLGQDPPGSVPELFMPGLISTHDMNHCVGFLEAGKVCVYSIAGKGTYSLYETDGRWTRPETVPWQNDRGSTDFTVGPDGHTVFFQSRRPTTPGDDKLESNTWKVEWAGEGWGEPFPLPQPANTAEYHELYPSIAPDGSLYFFAVSRPDTRIGDIYRSRFVNGEYLEAERLPAPINSDYYEVDPVIAPDGSYLLFGSGRPGGYGLLDLYVSFLREDGRWTHPVNAGPELNPFSIPTRMSITPDGEYYFFPSRHESEASKGEEVVTADIERWGDYDVYWMDTSFVADLRAAHLERRSAAVEVAREYRERGVFSASTLLSQLHDNHQDDYFFELSEFMTFYGEMMSAGETEEADLLYSTLLDTIFDEYRIKQGYAITCILNGRISRGLSLMKEAWVQFPSLKPVGVFMIPFQLRMKGRAEDELAALRFFACEYPDSAFAQFDLAAALERYEYFEEARENCARALDLKPGFEAAIEMRERLGPG
jgi:tetratricopeptide (TPR) repeat protein